MGAMVGGWPVEVRLVMVALDGALHRRLLRVCEVMKERRDLRAKA
jgi:hypothetical protein